MPGSRIAQLVHTQRVRLLYKSILKLHRGLSPDLAYLGDSYVREEFRRHKKATPEQSVAFMEAWSKYAVTLSKQLGLKGPGTASGKVGKPIPEEQLDDFNGEQLLQLYSLYEEAAKFSPAKEKNKKEADPR